MGRAMGRALRRAMDWASGQAMGQTLGQALGRSLARTMGCASEGASDPALGWASVCGHLFPRCCLLCGEPGCEGPLCATCQCWLPPPGFSCRQCALPGLPGPGLRCGGCIRSPPRWDYATTALVYRYPADRLIQRFKFQRDLACGQLLADRLIRAVKHRPAVPTGPSSVRAAACPNGPQLLVPVPLHFTRQWQRGFNQAEFLARQLGRGNCIPVRTDLLRRHRKTPSQAGLDQQQRRTNLRGAFTCNATRLRQSGAGHIGLVDDVLTTGTTLNECARVLRSAGAACISVWVCARVPQPGQS